MRFSAIVIKNVVRRPLRSALTVAGVAVAVGTMVALVSFSKGLRDSSLDTYRGHGIDVVVLRAGVTERLTSNLNEELARTLSGLARVAEVNPSLTDMVSFGEDNFVGVPIHGWPTEGFAAKSLKIVSGRRLTPGDTNGMMLGRTLADSLKKQVGDAVEVEGAAFRVVGIYEANNFFENCTAVVSLVRLQELMDRPHQVTEFQLSLQEHSDDSISELRQSIRTLKNSQGESLGLEAMPTEEFVTSSSEVELARILANVSSIIALVIGSVGILNTMVMTVMERTQEIGALRAIGWRRSRIVRLILGESLIMSVAGGAAGIVAAAVLLRVLSQSPMVQSWIAPEVNAGVAGAGMLVAVLMAAGGGFYPAYRAIRCSPVEALRHD